MKGNTAEWRDVMRLFEQWLTLDPQGQATLQAQARERSAATGAQLSRLIAADRLAASAEAGALPAAPLTGRRVGAWALREPIGEGGMGQVWLASRSDGLHHGLAAVKLLAGGRGGAGARERFAREAECLAQLNHPNIAKLLDVGVLDADTDTEAGSGAARYLVLEYVEGERLDHGCDARRLTLAARLRLFLQVCDAVSFAHAHLIVHRDLKPANVMLGKDGSVKLLDFGVAKLMGHGEAGAASELTCWSAAGLTPEYAAPEQVQGGAITTATDVYALGVMLFRLLSGGRPYGAAGESPAALARHIVETEPLQLGRAVAGCAAGDGAPAPAEIAERRGTTPARLAQALAGDLSWIVGRALRKPPAERYASVQALADDLQRHLRHEPVSARPPSWRYRSVRFVRRHRAGVAAAAVASVAVLAGVAATAWQAQVAREQARVAREEAEVADGMKDFVFEVFDTARLGAGSPSAPGEARVQDLLREASRRLMARDDMPLATRMELFAAMSLANLNNGLPQEAQALRRHAVAVARQGYGANSAGLASAEYELATLLAVSGQAAEADALLNDVLRIGEAAQLWHTDTLALALNQLAVNATRRGEPRVALPYQQRAVALLAEHHPQHRQRSVVVRGLGVTLMALEQFGAAEQALNESIAVGALADGLRDYSEAAARTALGRLYLRTGRAAEARAQLLRGLPAVQAATGARSRHTAELLVELALAQHALHDAAAARDTLASADEIARERPLAMAGSAADRVLLARAVMALGAGDLPAAASAARAAQARWAPGGGLGHADALLVLAEVELAAGQPRAGRDAAQQALALADRALGEGSLLARRAQALVASAGRVGAANEGAAR